MASKQITSTAGVIVLCTLALIFGLYLSLSNNGFFAPKIKSEEIEGFFWPNQKRIEPFTMVDQNNSDFTLEHFRGKWSFLFFGYTHCPDICPITMQQMKEANGKLLDQHPELESTIQMIFVSVDGERDTPEHLKNYVEFFGDFIGLTGSEVQLQGLTTQLGVPYSIEPHEPGNQNYLVEHSGAIFLISPQGMLASIYQPPFTPQGVSDRFQQILQFLDQ